MTDKLHGDFLCCTKCGQAFPYPRRSLSKTNRKKEAMQLKENAVNGYLGTEWKTFVLEHPEGDFDCSSWKLVRCSCGAWGYTASVAYKWRDQTDGRERTETFNHACPKCGETMHLSDEEDGPVLCMDCGGSLLFRSF